MSTNPDAVNREDEVCTEKANSSTLDTLLDHYGETLCVVSSAWRLESIAANRARAEIVAYVQRAIELAMDERDRMWAERIRAETEEMMKHPLFTSTPDQDTR